MRKALNILTFLFVAALVIAANTDNIIPQTRVNVYGNDTILASGQRSIDRDSTYKMLATYRGVACVKFCSVTYFDGIPGDTITWDSTATSGSSEVYKTIKGDSLYSAAFNNWTSYNATARNALKSSSSLFKIQFFLKMYSATNTPYLALYRQTD